MKPLRSLLVTVCLFLAGCVTAPAPQSTRFKILQINDVYKIEGLEGGQIGGLARVRTLRKLLESDGSTVLVMHGGDALFPSVMSKFLEARPMVDVLNLLDGNPDQFDSRLLAGFGNHELDKSDDKVLLARLKDSQFHWVVSNTLHCTSASECVPFKNVGGPVTDVSLIPIGSRKIGVLGVLYPVTKPYARSTDVVAATREAVTRLKASGADVILAITHQEMPDDVRLAEQVPGLDVVIGGHDHLYSQQRVGNTWITKADADAKSVMVYDITVDANGRVATTPVRVALDGTVPKDPVVEFRVQHWLNTLADKMGGNATVGMTRNLMEGVEPAIRGRETALGNLLTDAAREQMGTDITILNGGSIRINDNIPPGPITRYDMEGIFYYANNLVAVRVTGAQLLDMLRNSVSRADAGDGRFLQISGMRFSYRAAGGTFDVQPADVEVGGTPLDLNATYTVSTTDFIYTRGVEDGFTLFAEATRPPRILTEREADFRTTVESYIRARGTVTQAVEGRIVRRP